MKLTDREFMSLIEQQVLAGEPSSDPVIKDNPNRTPEGLSAQYVLEKAQTPPADPNWRERRYL